ncbi:MAG: competence/damage-inducible protein A [Bacteroidota bacterium]
MTVKAEIISIGDELLIGQTVNTNAAWIGRELSLLGIEIHRITTISDQREEIISAISASPADIILMTGGLGPTNDDITKSTLASYFGSKLVRNTDIVQRIESYFSQRGREVSEVNRQQADLPDNCTVLTNPLGTASGMWFEKNGKIVISMPGVPYETKAIMTNEVLPRLKERFPLPHLVHRTILTQGIGESFLAEIIKDWETRLRNDGLSLAYLPSPGIVKLRITAKGGEKNNLEKQVNTYINELLTLVPQYIYGFENDRLEQLVGNLLTEKKQTLSTAESCTGGYIAHMITSVPGSSAYFMGTVVSYSNRIKTEILEVKEADLNNYGAVSREVVEQMALGIQKKFQTGYSIAVSGVAGPDGGSDEKPVGTVWIAIAFPGGVESKKFLFEADRIRNIHRTALTALTMLRKKLLEK